MLEQMMEIVDKSGQIFHRIAWQVGPQNLYLSKLPSHPRLFARCNTGLVELHVFPAIEFVWTSNGWERGSGLWNGIRAIRNVTSEFVPSVAKIRELSRPSKKAG
jgi:hypothetical protein